MLTVCPYFHVHQPYRVKRYKVFDIGNDNQYFNDNSETDLNNRKIVEKVAEKSYRPMNYVLGELLAKHPEFRFSLSFSGTVLDQFEDYTPDVLESFQELVKSGRVEILADTYHHSLAFFYSQAEFERQVDKHARRVKELFDYTPRVFRNTELSYRNDLAKWCEDNGYLGIMAEGWDPVLGWRSPNHLYHPVGCNKIKVLLKNYKLSDDLAFRFGNREWASYPLDADTYTGWINAHHGDGNTINLFMDYETFGEHQWEDTGIFDFMKVFPEKLLFRDDTSFKTATETVESYGAVGEIDVPHIMTWADTDRDLTAWTGNDIQKDAIAATYGMEGDVMATEDDDIIETWRKLQTSDHFYYMCTKWSNDGDVHAYFSPYQSPYDAYVAFMNALSDLQLRVTYAVSKKEKQRRDEEKKAELRKPIVDSVEPSWTIWDRIKNWFKKVQRAFYSFFKRQRVYKFYAHHKEKTGS